ncbi:gliding motility-associated protein GldE [Flavisolibacter ginsenosidimutans]|uniref:Gliding motility-associated protein GldE n=1 Tax=Flavisolibacter ginsenosidimutans TaxID=661481 RepID=A0A5B8UKC1_9BACT|nr:gliding motility-associated protein GldE [Flavisolibacter ginsenosidimutans]QEC57141.1 gliding motility-associated protein GldE [Flavisolibacter ginsenosidimutans]
MDYYAACGLLHILLQNPLASQGTVLMAVLLLVLLFLSFLVSGAEVALFSLQPRDVNMLKTKQHDAAKRITSLLENRKEVYTTLLIAGGIFNISIIFLAYLLLAPLKIITLHTFIDIDLEILVKIIIIAFVLVFVCKILPKLWATQNTLRFAYTSAALVEGLHLLLGSISARMVSIADSISKTSGADESDAVSMRELDDAIEITNVETSVEEKNILKGVVKFGNITVRQIMRSRLDVNGLEYGAPFAEVVKKVEELHYSRLPVYKSSLDEIVGVLNTKDLLPYLNETDFDWHGVIRSTLFVPETKLIKDLLTVFKTKRIHFAIVVDEFGGTSGIVTMEDILEEIIGDIRDEFDEEENTVRKVDDHTYIADAKVMLPDLCRAMRLPIDTFDAVKGESESLAGLVLEIAGELLQPEQKVTSGDFEFTVLETERARIKTVKIFVNHESEQ